MQILKIWILTPIMSSRQLFAFGRQWVQTPSAILLFYPLSYSSFSYKYKSRQSYFFPLKQHFILRPILLYFRPPFRMPFRCILSGLTVQFTFSLLLNLPRLFRILPAWPTNSYRYLHVLFLVALNRSNLEFLATSYLFFPLLYSSA